MAKQRLNNLYCKILFGIALLKTRISNKRIPLIAHFIITNRCNLKCFYCYVDTEHKKAQEIEINKLFELIDILYRQGCRLIVLLGGEPLLYKGFGNVVSYIKKKRMVCEVITNGYFVKDHIDTLAKCDSICISLDGDEEAHDRNRGKGSYRKAVDAIELLRKRKIPVRIKGVLTKNNFDSLEYLCNYAREKSLMMTVTRPAVSLDRVYSQEGKWLTEKEKRSFIDRLISLKKKGMPIGYSFTALNYVRNWPYEEDFVIKRDRTNHTKRFKLLRCRRKDNALYIDADGSMYPCANQWGHNGKNVYSDGFNIAWEHMVNYDCYACGLLPEVDLSLLFNCNPENMLNAFTFFKGK